MINKIHTQDLNQISFHLFRSLEPRLNWRGLSNIGLKGGKK